VSGGPSPKVRGLKGLTLGRVGQDLVRLFVDGQEQLSMLRGQRAYGEGPSLTSLICLNFLSASCFFRGS
jgi:hypothetical protein